MDKPLYEWGQHTLRKLDQLGRDVLKLDTDKRPPIPESNEARTGVVKKFKEKIDVAHDRQKKIIERLKGENGPLLRHDEKKGRGDCEAGLVG